MIQSWLQTMKEGEFMTRISAAATKNALAVTADSMFTNTITNEKTINNQKIYYGNNMIVGLLGSIEFITSQGTVSLSIPVQKCLDDSSQSGIELINEIEKSIIETYKQYSYNIPTSLIFFWRENDTFYMFCSEIRYVNHHFGTAEIKVYYPFGNIHQNNMDLFDFSNRCIQAGDGLITNPQIDWISKNSNVLDVSFRYTKEAILSPQITTVGGPVYSIVLDEKGFHTKIEGQLYGF